jgi:hypothetical protein
LTPHIFQTLYTSHLRWGIAGPAGVSLTKKFNEVARSQSLHGG